LSYIISHDLAVIHAMSHHVIVMQAGQLIEQAETEQLFYDPQSAYTKTLISASGF